MFSGHALAALRIVAGFLYACHGLQGLFGAFGAEPREPLSFHWFGGLLELILGALIVLGLFTTWTAFLASGQMALRYFVVHQGQGLLPIQNGGEVLALNSFVFLFFAAAGPGRFSLDALRLSPGSRAEGEKAPQSGGAHSG